MQRFNDGGASENFILNSLTHTEYEWLQPNLREVELQQGEMLNPAREPISTVYFPTTCLLSWVKTTETGDAIELGTTGNEGLSAIAPLLNEDTAPWQTQVQLAGNALKLSAEDFATALNQSISLRQRVTAFTHLKLVQLSQSALCNRFHSVEERLCRWLLAAQDHSQTSEFLLTREILAEMIGAGRPTVSLTTGSLQTAGLIRANRGKITILDRAGIEEVACECYQIVRKAFDQYLAKEIN